MQRPLTAPNNSEVGRSSTTSKSLQFSTLFATMLESNALLREEIDHMERSGQKSTGIDGASTTQRRHAATGKRGAAEREGEVRIDSGRRVEVEALHSQSLPARLLDTSTVDSAPESGGQSEDSSGGTPPTQSHPSQDGASTREKFIHRNSLDSMSHSDSTEEVERMDTDEASMGEGEEEGVATLHSDPSMSTAHRPCARGRQSELPAPPPLSLTSLSSSSSSTELSVSSENDPFATPGESTIERMWDNFSVEEYASPPLRQREQNVRRVSKPVRPAWSPQITIPEPFSMTVREAAKVKKKSRALISAEERRLERELQEEVECQKRFRALPIPATTYVPLQELEKEKSEKQATSKTVQPIKPFNFMQREEEKRQRMLRALTERKSTDTNQRNTFKAKPIPQSILSPRVSEELKEREEYRRIRIKVRSQEMLATAELPRSMQVKGREYTVGKLRQQRMDSRQGGAFEHTFRPKINPEIPDHDRQYSQFQQQMAAKRRVKPPTSSEPFTLKTSLPSSRKMQIQKELAEYSTPSSQRTSSRSTYASSTSVGNTCRSRSQVSQQHMYTIQMTEAAKLRQSVSQRKLADEAAREAAEEERRRARREQARELQGQVLQKVQSYDHTAWLQEKQREKLQELRSAQ